MNRSNEKVMLELRDVSLSFQASKGRFDHGFHHVLDSVSFKLYENETLGIIGRNGVGQNHYVANNVRNNGPYQWESFSYPG